jgi:hypothetical protein
MPDIKLGPQGNETTLPAINWDAGGQYELPTGYAKNVDKATMLDGKARVNIRPNHQKNFTLEWAQLTQAQVLVLRALAELNEPLRYQENRLDSTWRWVWVASLDVESLESTHVSTALYRVTMALEEAW